MRTPAVSTQKGGDGTLIVTVGGDPLTFNPNFQVDDNAFVPACNIYNTLVTLDSSYAILPELAKSWETSEDGLTITFTLVDNATWHDGQPVTSTDVKYTFDTIIANDKRRRRSSFFSSVASIDAPDATTLVLNMKQPSASLISFLGWYGTFILPAHIYDGTDWTTNPANQNPVGSGPFKFVSYSAGASIELEANLDYWGEGPFVDRLVLSIIPDSNTALQSLLNGETDVLTVTPPRSQIATLEQTDGIAVATLPIPSFYYVQMNVNREYTSNLEVRRAISLAINRQQIVDVALGGYSAVATTFYPTEIPWAANTDPDAAVPQYDPEAAKAALDAAGFPLQRRHPLQAGLPPLHARCRVRRHGGDHQAEPRRCRNRVRDRRLGDRRLQRARACRRLRPEHDLRSLGTGSREPQDPRRHRRRRQHLLLQQPEVDKLLDEGSTHHRPGSPRREVLGGPAHPGPGPTDQPCLHPESSSTRTPIRVTVCHSTKASATIGINRFTITTIED